MVISHTPLRNNNCRYDLLGSFVFVFNFYDSSVLLWSLVRIAHALHAVLAICIVIFQSKIYDDDDDDKHVVQNLQ